MEQTPRLVLTYATPLLEKEGHLRCSALSLERLDPYLFHRACPGSTFATHNHPVDAGEVHFA